MCSMDTVFNCVIPYIQNGDDRNSVTLVCHKWNEIGGFTRKHVTVHMHYAPTPARLFKQFPFLVSLTLKGIKKTKSSIDLTQWIREIAIKFTRLKSLRIHHLVIYDSDLELLAKNRGKDLLSLKICECKGFSKNGLMCVAKYCSELTELCLDIINLVVDDEVVEEHDLIITGTPKKEIDKFKAQMEENFEMSDLGLLAYYLGIEVTQTNGDISIKQFAYANKILKEAEMINCNETLLPMDPGTRPTKKQATVALSSSESEFIAATATVIQALWLKRLLSKLTHSEEYKVTIRVDNKSAIALMKNPLQMMREQIARLKAEVKWATPEAAG
nr:ribonuclease H-like domain, reverse transcriptase, RNA-dependent DNA polymerase [Tanacetum cinerariifolium]